jgi:hypothetical protein
MPSINPSSLDYFLKRKALMMSRLMVQLPIVQDQESEKCGRHKINDLRAGLNLIR